MENRRAFLRLAAFGLAAVGAPATALAASIPVPSGETPPHGDAPWWLFAPLEAGNEVGFGWALAKVYAPVEGAVTVNLANRDGRVARVDLSLREGRAKGPASTELIDFIVMDGGDGASPMDEPLGRAVVRLAAIVSENEHADIATLSRLLPHADRVWRHAEAMEAAAARLAPGIG